MILVYVVMTCTLLYPIVHLSYYYFSFSAWKKSTLLRTRKGRYGAYEMRRYAPPIGGEYGDKNSYSCVYMHPRKKELHVLIGDYSMDYGLDTSLGDYLENYPSYTFYKLFVYDEEKRKVVIPLSASLLMSDIIYEGQSIIILSAMDRGIMIYERSPSGEWVEPDNLPFGNNEWKLVVELGILSDNHLLEMDEIYYGSTY